METADQLHFTVDIINDICIGITILTTGLQCLKENADALYEYTRVLPAI